MSMHSEITESMGVARPANPLALPALTLAYLGDTVYDLYVRTTLAETLQFKMRELHLEAAKHVCAAGQAAAYRRIADVLNEEEQAAFRRGRNAHSATVPKHADVRDYRVATGLEALLGHLYLLGRDDRIGELMRLALPLTNDLTKEPER